MARDLRRYAQQTNFRLALGGIFILFVIGDGLIYWIYGQGAALLGLICLALGLAPVALIALALWGVEWIARRADKE